MQPLTKSNFKNTGSKTSNIMYLYFRQSNAITKLVVKFLNSGFSLFKLVKIVAQEI